MGYKKVEEVSHNQIQLLTFAAAQALPTLDLLPEQWVMLGREGLFIKLRKYVPQHIGTDLERRSSVAHSLS